MHIKTVNDIVAWRSCLGCGACAYICPEKKIVLVNVEPDGIRPRCGNPECGTCTDCIKVCPGIELHHDTETWPRNYLGELNEGWGPVIEIWEGYATDPEIRFSGSSGGAATALGLHSVEKNSMSGIVHIGMDEEKPWLNKTRFSRNRLDLLANSGSRYSPASPCDGLSLIENAEDKCVFIGKPCDVAGIYKAGCIRAGLKEKTGLTISIFCAGTPSTFATLELLHKHSIKEQDVEEIRYRGKGWPGNFSVKLKEKDACELEMTYMESWDFLQRYRPFRCYLCADSTGEFADIAVGDPWYRKIKNDPAGFSLFIIRSDNGKNAFDAALRDGYIYAEKVSPDILPRSQTLLQRRSAIWGRTIALKTFGIPTVEYGSGFPLFKNWMTQLSIKEKIQSFAGTVKRILSRRYWKSQGS